jgi:DNA-directed RNA polymerase subunit M/transcription elongation factor TFIIS
MQAETFAFKCGKCGQNRTRYYQMQTRSADEPMTVSILQACKKGSRLTPYTLADIRNVRLASNHVERAQPTDEMPMLFFRCINCSNKSVSVLLVFH